MDYTIRKATLDDCEELSRLKHVLWDQTYRGIYSDEKIDEFDYEKHKNKFMKIIDDPNVTLYVVEASGKLIGYMDYGVPYRPYKDYAQEIGLLYLLSNYQRHGIGTQLFNIGYNGIKDKGYDEFFISCNKYNTKAQEFYKRMGGEIINVDEDMEDKSYPQMTFLYKIKR